MKQLLTVLALAALAACGGNEETEDTNTGAATTPEATAPVADPIATPAAPVDSAAAAGTTTPAPAAGTDSAPAAPASY